MDLSKLSNEELRTYAKQQKALAALFDTRQSTFKVLNNSLYGALGSVHFRFYAVPMATAITLSGFAGINVMSNATNDYINRILKNPFPRDYIVASDTDSAYVNVSEVVAKLGILEEQAVEFLDRWANGKLQDAISAGVTKFNEDTNAMFHRLYFKRESIAKGLIIAKKRYLFKVYDNEGVRYAEPEIKVTGLESRRSSTPAWCRAALEDSYALIFQPSESVFQAQVKKTRKEYMELPLETIAAASSANNLRDFIGPDGNHIKGTPAHIKGAIYFNKRLTEMGLDKKYPPIRSGDKVKVLMLREPNLFKNDAVAFSDKLPPEMQVEEYVDRPAMYEKFFNEPLRRVAEVRGWTTEKVNRLF
jgi:hypothetical protein